jgi:hypothetical protein
LAGSAFTAEAIASLLNLPAHGDGFTLLFAIKPFSEKKKKDADINDSSSIIGLTIFLCRSVIIARTNKVRTRFKVVMANK